MENLNHKNLVSSFTELIQNALCLHLTNTYINKKLLENNMDENKITILIENILEKEIFSKSDNKQILQLNTFLTYKKYELSLFLSKKIYQRYENYKIENDTNEVLMLELIDFMNKLLINIKKMEINFDTCGNISKILIIYFVKCITSTIYTIIIEKNLFAIKYIEVLVDFYENFNDMSDISYNNNLFNKIKNKIK